MATEEEKRQRSVLGHINRDSGTLFRCRQLCKDLTNIFGDTEGGIQGLRNVI